MRGEEEGDLGTQLRIVAARPVQVSLPLLRGILLHGGKEDLLEAIEVDGHGECSRSRPLRPFSAKNAVAASQKS